MRSASREIRSRRDIGGPASLPPTVQGEFQSKRCEIEEYDETAEDGVSSHLIEHLSHFERPGDELRRFTAAMVVNTGAKPPEPVQRQLSLLRDSAFARFHTRPTRLSDTPPSVSYLISYHVRSISTNIVSEQRL